MKRNKRKTIFRGWLDSNGFSIIEPFVFAAHDKGIDIRIQTALKWRNEGSSPSRETRSRLEAAFPGIQW